MMADIPSVRVLLDAATVCVQARQSWEIAYKAAEAARVAEWEANQRLREAEKAYYNAATGLVTELHVAEFGGEGFAMGFPHPMPKPSK